MRAISPFVLLLGPFGYLRARRYGRAAIAFACWLAPIALFAYLPYLQAFADLNTGDTARELVDASIGANRVLIATAPTWLPRVALALAINHTICAIDLARLVRSGGLFPAEDQLPEALDAGRHARDDRR